MHFLFLGLISIQICYSQSNNDNNWKYYPFNNYGLELKFPDEPQYSDPIDNSQIYNIEFRYAYPDFENKQNYSFSIALYKFKHDKIGFDSTSKVDLIVSIMNFTLVSVQKGQLIKQEKTTYKGMYSVDQQVDVTYPNFEEKIRVYSKFFYYQGNVFRIYTFTPMNSTDNKDIKYFFDSLLKKKTIPNTQ